LQTISQEQFEFTTLAVTSLDRAGSGILRKGFATLLHQQPDGDDTPGIAVAPVAFAGAIIPGVARFIVVPSAHADVFGVGTTVIVGSMLVPTNSVISG
jgi:hypothetical protein